MGKSRIRRHPRKFNHPLGLAEYQPPVFTSECDASLDTSNDSGLITPDSLEAVASVVDCKTDIETTPTPPPMLFEEQEEGWFDCIWRKISALFGE